VRFAGIAELVRKLLPIPDVSIHPNSLNPKTLSQRGQQGAVAAGHFPQQGGEDSLGSLCQALTEAFDDFVFGVDADGSSAGGTGARPKMGIEQAQEGMQPGSRRQRGIGVAVEQVLADGHSRTQSGDGIDVGG
jgi:hypothetical protein